MSESGRVSGGASPFPNHQAGQSSNSPAPAASQYASVTPGSTFDTHRGCTALNANTTGPAESVDHSTRSMSSVEEAQTRLTQEVFRYLEASSTSQAGHVEPRTSSGEGAYGQSDRLDRAIQQAESVSLPMREMRAQAVRRAVAARLESSADAVEQQMAQQVILASFDGPLARKQSTASDLPICQLLTAQGHTTEEQIMLLKAQAGAPEQAAAYLDQLLEGVLTSQVQDDREEMGTRHGWSHKSTATSTYSAYRESAGGRGDSEARPLRGRSHSPPSRGSCLSARASRSSSPQRHRSRSPTGQLVSFEGDGQPSHQPPQARGLASAEQEQSMLLEIIDRAGYNRDALRRLVQFVSSSDGPTLSIAQHFIEQSQLSGLAFLQYDRVVSTLLGELRRQPHAVHDGTAFLDAWQFAVSVEQARLSETGFPSLEEQRSSVTRTSAALLSPARPGSAGGAVNVAQQLFSSGADAEETPAMAMQARVRQMLSDSTASSTGAFQGQDGVQQSGLGAAGHVAQQLFGATTTRRVAPATAQSLSSMQPADIVSAVLDHATRSGWVTPANMPAGLVVTSPQLGSATSDRLAPPHRGLPESLVSGAPGGHAARMKDSHPDETVSHTSLSVTDQLTAWFLPANAFAMVEWFDAEPPSDRMSNVLQRATCTFEQAVEAFFHREHRRRARMATEQTRFDYLRAADYLRTGERAYVTRRGDFHVELLDFRFDRVAIEGTLARACKAIIDLLNSAVAHASRAHNSPLRLVAARVDTQARSGPTDSTISSMLATIDEELLPTLDDDERALMEVEWHPTNVGARVVRTAYALLDKLANLATIQSRTIAEVDIVALKYFRAHVARARLLPNLAKAELGRTLPDLVHNAYCTAAARSEYTSIAVLLSKLKESSGLGPVLLCEAERRGRPPPLPPPSTNAADDGDVDGAADALAGMGVSDNRKKYMDIELIRKHAAEITLLTMVDDQRVFTPLSEVPDFMECELGNPGAEDGFYGGPAIGACPVCIFAMRGALKAQFSMEEFRSQFKGGPTDRQGARPVPPDAVITHPLDDCYRLRRAVKVATERRKPPPAPAKLNEPVAPDTRASRWAAFLARCLPAKRA